MPFPEERPRRLRANPAIRRMVRQTHLRVDDLIQPYFVMEGEGVRNEIRSMPGQFQLSVDTLVEEVRKLHALKVPAIILFGLPSDKDEQGSGAFAEDGIIQLAIKAVKAAVPEMYVITDVCMCEYTSHGHCGHVDTKGEVVNDLSLEMLGKTALSHVVAGADMVAPSDMMDGRVDHIREILDDAGYTNIPIMAYSAKFASAYYGPFRDAADSAPQFGDRQAYQMDPANSRESIYEMTLDDMEGADILMVKPALPYLDILSMGRERFHQPFAAYHVSGEYAMIKAAAANGWIDERRLVLETLLCIKRAGADLILTYYAADVAAWLAE